jgi:hypothetical protein
LAEQPLELAPAALDVAPVHARTLANRTSACGARSH